jgi:hypothetical protein
VGVYMATFASFEYILWVVYGTVLGEAETSAMRLLGDESFKRRLDAIDRYVEVRFDADAVKGFKHLFKTAVEINGFRNKLAHGLYQTDASQSIVVVDVYLADPKREGKGPIWLVLTEDLLDRETRKINRAFNFAKGLCIEYRPQSVTPTTIPDTEPRGP